jgi:hypothetical protein
MIPLQNLICGSGILIIVVGVVLVLLGGMYVYAPSIIQASEPHPHNRQYYHDHNNRTITLDSEELVKVVTGIVLACREGNCHVGTPVRPVCNCEPHLFYERESCHCRHLPAPTVSSGAPATTGTAPAVEVMQNPSPRVVKPLQSPVQKTTICPTPEVMSPIRMYGARN